MRLLLVALSSILSVQTVVALDDPAVSAGRVTRPITPAGMSGRASWNQVQAPAATHISSRVTVAVPHDATGLTVDDKPVTGTGTIREFDTEPLPLGGSYKYTFTATWQPNNYTVITRSKTIEFRAGDTVRVDLTTDDPNDRAKVRFVATPDDVAARMVALAGVTKDDVVYEPGCGDARITIAAVKAGAKKGVGIDIDPDRVAQARANVKAADMELEVEIRLGDALDIKDLSKATVVFLYMGDEFDMLIRPILWKQLGVGARIVSHRFRMGDWQPDRTVVVTSGFDPMEEYELHLWTITQEIKDKAAGL